MNAFVEALVKFSLIVAVVICAFLLLLLGMVIFSPNILCAILRFCLIVVMIIAVGYLLVSITSLLCFLVSYMKYSKSKSEK